MKVVHLKTIITSLNHLQLEATPIQIILRIQMANHHKHFYDNYNKSDHLAHKPRATIIKCITIINLVHIMMDTSKTLILIPDTMTLMTIRDMMRLMDTNKMAMAKQEDMRKHMKQQPINTINMKLTIINMKLTIINKAINMKKKDPPRPLA